MSVKMFVIVIVAVAALAGAAVAMHHGPGAKFMKSLRVNLHGADTNK